MDGFEGFTIRNIDISFTYDDLYYLADIRNSCSEAFTDTRKVYGVDNIKWWESFDAKERFYVICSGERVIGSIYWEYINGDENSIEIGKIMLHKDFRGKGIIQLAISEILRKVPHNIAWLEVKIDNLRAIKAYRKAGFMVSGETGKGSILMYKAKDEYIRNKIAFLENQDKQLRK